MTQGNPLPLMVKFAIPMLIGGIFQLLYNMVDTVVLGRYVGVSALASIGVTGTTVFGIVQGGCAVMNAISVVAAQCFGSGDDDRLKLVVGNSIWLVLITGAVLGAVGFWGARPIMQLIGTPDEILGLSSAYVNILYFAIPFQMLSNNFTAISRAVGESRKPLIYFTASIFVNFALDMLFIKVFRWSVEGAALATLISHITAAVLTGNYILRRNTSVHISKKELKLDLKTAFIQLKLGIPVSLQFTVTSIGSMCLQSAVNSFGTATIAGFTAAGRVENIANIPLSGLSVGTQTFVGQNYGAGKYDRIIKSVKKIFTLNILLSVALSVALLTAGMPIVRLFMTEPNEDVLFAAHKYLIATAECFSLVAVLFVLRNTLQGLGFTYANAVAGAGELIGRISIALIFTPLIGFNAVCYAAPAAWLLADIPLAIIYLKKKKKFKALAMRNMNTTADI